VEYLPNALLQPGSARALCVAERQRAPDTASYIWARATWLQHYDTTPNPSVHCSRRALGWTLEDYCARQPVPARRLQKPAANGQEER